MILLDTNIIIDLFGTNENLEAEWSRRCYRRVIGGDISFCNHVIVAELVGQSDLPDAVLDKLEAFQIGILDMPIEAAFSAGHAYAAYRARGGRKTMLPDFLIGGHAIALGATMMTRDRRLASYFPELSLITPETHPHG